MTAFSEKSGSASGQLIACQGTEGAYSSEAAGHLFPEGRLLYFKNFRAVARAVKQGLCAYGVLPIENNTYGSVRDVSRIICEEDVYIVRSFTLRIRHRLLALPGASQSDIRTIYSHEQAFGQCAEFLHSLGDRVRLVPDLNTATAARRVAESGDLSVAAISSPECAKLYGLTVLKSGIADTRTNYTRFVCIARHPEFLPEARRISLMLTLPHRPGSLASILAGFADEGIDLLKIESAPIPGKDFEFRFYLDFEGTDDENRWRLLTEKLEKECPEFRFLGRFTEETAPETPDFLMQQP